ncbi:MAG: DUF5615 family PIN-like protein [Chloroflexi bacterium]|nr:DUF5615 family PIN-like protein [Chloroflexota bacterium]
MRLLLDTCVWGGVISDLEAAGHDVDWVGNWVEDPGDDNILAHALAHGQILVTLDKDFGELAVSRGRPHSGIVRLVNWSARMQAQACVTALERYQQELLNGALVTLEPGRGRVRL